MNINEAQILLEETFRRKVQKDPKIRNAYMLIHSEKHSLHLNMAEGVTGDMPANPNQPYHIASIGKLFVSVLTGILNEQGRISYEDTIDKYLDKYLLEGLHVYKGIDYTNQVKIKHILNMTSGLNDYFEDKPKEGKAMLDMIFQDPQRSWSPEEVILWSKKNLKSHFPPGKGFHYSDTGYHLLGLILEKVTSLPLDQALKEYIFTPLEMHHSYLATSTNQSQNKNQYPVANVYVKDINATNYSILRDDYAGGGIVATSEDLLKFMKALSRHKIIKKTTFEKMKDWAGHFNIFFMGIDYGYGLMSFKTIPLLQPKKYNVWGNAGSIGSFMFYQRELDAYFIGSLNQFRYHSKGIRLMFKMIDILSKC